MEFRAILIYMIAEGLEVLLFKRALKGVFEIPESEQ